MTQTQEKIFSWLKSDEFVEWAVENLHRADATYREGVTTLTHLWSLMTLDDDLSRQVECVMEVQIGLMNMGGLEEVLANDIKKLLTRLSEFLPPEETNHVEA